MVPEPGPPPAASRRGRCVSDDTVERVGLTRYRVRQGPRQDDRSTVTFDTAPRRPQLRGRSFSWSGTAGTSGPLPAHSSERGPVRRIRAIRRIRSRCRSSSALPVILTTSESSTFGPPWRRRSGPGSLRCIRRIRSIRSRAAPGPIPRILRIVRRGMRRRLRRNAPCDICRGERTNRARFRGRGAFAIFAEFAESTPQPNSAICANSANGP